MLTGTNIVELFDFYLKEYCPEELIILDDLRQKLLKELKTISDDLKKTRFKGLPPECYIGQRVLDIYNLVEDKILDSCLTPDFYNLSCHLVSSIGKIFSVSPQDIDDTGMIALIDCQTGKIIGKKNSYPELRKVWTEYLGFSIDLMSRMISFLVCLEANKETFTEGRVKDLIKKYGSDRRFKM